MKTILIGGYFGFGNLGDEIILRAMLRRFRAESRDLSFIVASQEPAQTAAEHGVQSVSWLDVAGLVAAGEKADLVILGGGGVFHDYWGADPDSLLRANHTNIPYYMAFPVLATLWRKPLMLYAVGVGPLFSELGRELTRVAFDQASVATVRDQASLDLLAEIGVDTSSIRVTADPVFDLDDVVPPEREWSSAAEPTLAVAVRNWTHGVEPRYWERQVAEALDTFVEEEGGRVVFVPFMRGEEPFGDVPVSARIRAMMKSPRHQLLSPGQSAAVRADALSRCDIVLGMRLHAVLLAIRAALPVVALVYDPKVASAMSEAGAGGHLVDIGEIKARLLSDRLREAWRDRAALSRHFAGLRAALADKARETAALAMRLLDEPEVKPMTEKTQELLRDMTLSRVREELRLRAEVAGLREEVAALREKVAALETEKAELRLELAAQRQHAFDAHALRAELARWEKSRLGRVMLRYRALRWKMAGGRR